MDEGMNKAVKGKVTRNTVETLIVGIATTNNEVKELRNRARNLLSRFNEHLPEDPQPDEDQPINPIHVATTCQQETWKMTKQIHDTLYELEQNIGYGGPQ